MPPGFSYPVDTYVLGVREPVDVWLPYIFSSDDRVRGNSFGYNLHVVGRLRDGVSIEQRAGADGSDHGEPCGRDAALVYGPCGQGRAAARVRDSWRAHVDDHAAWPRSRSSFSSPASISRISCWCARLTRTRELGIRAALGASRWDLSRVLLLESLILSLTGAALGAAVAWWGVDVLRSAHSGRGARARPRLPSTCGSLRRRGSWLS